MGYHCMVGTEGLGLIGEEYDLDGKVGGGQVGSQAESRKHMQVMVVGHCWQCGCMTGQGTWVSWIVAGGFCV